MGSALTKLSFPKVNEIHLPNAPLEAVLAQVRFEAILAINEQTNIVNFQDALRGTYPVLKRNTAHNIELNVTDGRMTPTKETIWRFTDKDDVWRVSLSPTFVALETKRYGTRVEFKQRFSDLLETLAKFHKPTLVDRVGLRYVDRIHGEALKQIETLVKAPLLGVMTSDMHSVLSASVTESVFIVETMQISARWGMVPAGATIDPNVMKSLSETSWLLDIDNAISEKEPWDNRRIIGQLDRLAEQSYRFFRWAVTDDFLKFYGGRL